ncbi:MAG: DUF5906 domain-containing protein [Desulfobacula sp.]|nr:DUF5906 domain-containing protein [Desulfobacula sp.]
MNTEEDDDWRPTKEELEAMAENEHLMDEIDDHFEENRESFSFGGNQGVLVQDAIINRLNQIHAIVDYEGQTLILTETYDPILKQAKYTFSKKNDFFDKYANKTFPDPQNPKKTINEAQYWFRHLQRRTYKGIIFHPGNEFPGYYNLWKGFYINPQPGDWSLFQGHIRNIIANKDENIFQWIMGWMARIVQDPGGKRPGTAIVLRGEQGTGKSFYADMFGSLFTPHYYTLSQSSHLTGQFNSHLRNALIVFADEGFLSGDKKAEGVLKSLVTEPTINIEQKFKDVTTQKNNINLIIASNNFRVIPAAFEERRFFVTDLSTGRRKDIKYFSEIDNQMNNGGREAMLYDLQRWDYSKVDLRKIPRTPALFDQIKESMTQEEKFWYERLQAGTLLSFHDTWVNQVPFSSLYEEYKKFVADTKGTKQFSDTQFGKEILKLCKNIQQTKRSAQGVRFSEKIFPSLDECRKEFQQRVNMDSKILWDETEANTPSPISQLPFPM